jgi:hypothetical protein
MTQLDYARTLYYRHSGKTPLVRLLTALLTITPVAAAAGALYAVLAANLPILSIDKIVVVAAILLMMGFAFGVGGLTGKMLLWARVRNMAMVWAVAVWGAVLAWYVAWVVWEWYILRRWDYNPEFLFMFTHPRGVWYVAVAINKVGTITMGDRDDGIKGPVLWLLWAIEAGVVLGAATLVPYRMTRGLAFCEACQRWCRRREGILSVGPAADEDRLRARLALKDLSALEELGPADMSAPRRLRVDLQNCPACDAMHLLSVCRMEVSYNRQGQRSDKVRVLVDRLWLDPEQAKTVEEIKERVYAAPSGDAAAQAAYIAPLPSEVAVGNDDARIEPRGEGEAGEESTEDAEFADELPQESEVAEESPDAERGSGANRPPKGGMGF